MRHREDRWPARLCVAQDCVGPGRRHSAGRCHRHDARARAALFLGRAGAVGWNSIKRHDASKPAPALRRAIRIRDQECGN
jgi:hypothetical protein